MPAKNRIRITDQRGNLGLQHSEGWIADLRLSARYRTGVGNGSIFTFETRFQFF